MKQIYKMNFKNQYTQILFLGFFSLLSLMLIRVFFFFSYKDSFKDLSYYELFLSFIYGLRVDIISIFTFLGVFVLLLTIPFKIIFNKKYKSFLSILWTCVFLAIVFICVVDVIYFEFSQRHISNEVLSISNDLDLIINMAFNSLLVYTISFLIFSIFIFYFYFSVFNADLENQSINKRTYLYFFLVVLILFIGIRNSFGTKSFGMADAYSVSKTSSGTLAINGFFSFYRTIFAFEKGKRNQLANYDDSIPIAKRLLSSEKMPFSSDKYPIQRSLKTKDKQNNYNVLIVLLESWGAEHIDGYTKYKELNVTPYFKALSEKGIKYTNFYANGYRSIYGITSIYTGLTLPLGFKYLGSGLELTKLSYLGQIAKQNGYNTLAMQSANTRSYRVDAVSKLAGFDEFYGAEDIPNVEEVEGGGNRKPFTGTYDYNLFDFMNKKLNTLKEPFLSFMFTSTNHSEYHLPHSKFERYPHDVNNYNGYLNSLIYVDDALKRFMESVKDEPWFDNTIFIFTSDHGFGNALNEIGKTLRKDDIPLSSAEHFRIPLLIYAPKIFEAKEESLLGSQNDIPATIIDLLNFEGDFSIMGNSLFDSSIKDRFVYTFGGNQIVYIKDECFIIHNYKQVVETDCKEQSKIEDMEKELKALDSVEVELLNKNRWAN